MTNTHTESTPEQREKCVYHFPGGCTAECYAQSLINQATCDGSLKPETKTGQKRIEKIWQDAHSQGCSENL